MEIDASKLKSFKGARLIRKAIEGDDASFYDLVDLTMTEAQIDAACDELRHNDGAECTPYEFAVAYWDAARGAAKN